MTRLGSLFTGSGQLDEAVRSVFGGGIAWDAEVDPAASRLLAHRYPDVPNLGDLTAVDWSRAEPVDVLTGGFPCQDVSHAGKRAGMRAGTRSGLWAVMCDAIDQLRPALVVAENVRGLLSAEADSAVEPCAGCVGDGSDGHLRALGRVLGDLADLGYDAWWCGLRASDVGAPHGRFRVFILAADASGTERRGTEPDDLGPRSFAAAEPRERASAATDAANVRHERSRSTRERRNGSADRRITTANTPPVAAGRDEGRTEPTRLVRGSDAALSSAVNWGVYEPAIERWEAVLGRPAPAPTEPGPRGGQRLSARLTEWMMGWPDGWVTDVPGITRNDALRICGNGVVPQQAAEALRRLLAAESVAA